MYGKNYRLRSQRPLLLLNTPWSGGIGPGNLVRFGFTRRDGEAQRLKSIPPMAGLEDRRVGGAVPPAAGQLGDHCRNAGPKQANQAWQSASGIEWQGGSSIFSSATAN